MVYCGKLLRRWPKWFCHKEKFSVPAGPNLKNSAWPSINSLLRRESSLLAEELQHGSVPLPFEKGEDECSSRGEIDQHAERKAEGDRSKGRAADLLNLACGWASFVNRALKLLPIQVLPLRQHQPGLSWYCAVGEHIWARAGTWEETVTTLGKIIFPLHQAHKNKLPCCTFTYLYPTVIWDANEVGILKYSFIATVSILCIMHITFGVGMKYN